MRTVTYDFSAAAAGETPKGRMHYMEQDLEQEACFSIESRDKFLGLVFNLKDRTRYLVDGKPPEEFPKLHFNFAYVPEGIVDLALDKGNYSWFCVEFHEPYLKTVAEHFPALGPILRKISSKIPVFLFDPHRPITGAIVTCIYDVVYCEFTGEIQKQYLESKFVELMILCLGQNRNASPPTQADLEKIKAAGAYIENNLRMKLNVGFLADLVGLPMRKLEEGFKQLYGTTVIDFVQSERMRTALILLRDTNMPLERVASALGYSSTASFIRRFRRKFGQTPGQMRKNDDDE